MLKIKNRFPGNYYKNFCLAIILQIYIHASAFAQVDIPFSGPIGMGRFDEFTVTAPFNSLVDEGLVFGQTTINKTNMENWAIDLIASGEPPKLPAVYMKGIGWVLTNGHHRGIATTTIPGRDVTLSLYFSEEEFREMLGKTANGAQRLERTPPLLDVLTPSKSILSVDGGRSLKVGKLLYPRILNPDVPEDIVDNAKLSSWLQDMEGDCPPTLPSRAPTQNPNMTLAQKAWRGIRNVPVGNIATNVAGNYISSAAGGEIAARSLGESGRFSGQQTGSFMWNVGSNRFVSGATWGQSIKGGLYGLVDLPRAIIANDRANWNAGAPERARARDDVDVIDSVLYNPAR